MSTPSTISQQSSYAPPAPSLITASPFALRLRLCGLYVITHDIMAHKQAASDTASQKKPENRHVQIARAALAGGARIIQLRDKNSAMSQLLPIACELRRLTRAASALLIINDRVDLTLACDADGVHLGPDDLPVAVARRLLGPHRIIGASCGDAIEAQRATAQGVDYIGAGAVFSTATKHDAGAPIGLETLRAIVGATSLPVAAIGGIDRSNIVSTKESGAAMSCVVSAVTNAGDGAAMTQATRDLIAALR